MVETIIVSITKQVKGNINENEIKIPITWARSREDYIRMKYGYDLIANIRYVNNRKTTFQVLENGIKDMDKIISANVITGFKLVSIINNPYTMNLEYYFQNI